MTIEKLTELGFTNIPKDTADETAEAMFEQIDNDTAIADHVLDELIEENPEVCKDTHDDEMTDWVYDQADTLHGLVY